uniref:Uncharacterized protein LOC113799068 n=1 Tax=Dermatophagoides pteronyssinus TaxID=6956 RepID=A0A6P6YJM6_DERPT
GFSGEPGGEAHLGYSYCALASYVLLGLKLENAAGTAHADAYHTCYSLAALSLLQNFWN